MNYAMQLCFGRAALKLKSVGRLIQVRTLSSVPLSYLRVSKPNSDVTKCPVLIYHGLFGNKNNWKSLSNQICQRTKRVVYSFDLRNHGESPHVDGDHSDLMAMASDIDHFLHTNSLNKVVLIGHSLGGRVTSQFAFTWPDKVERLILVDITPLEKLPRIDFLSDDLFLELKSSIVNLPENIDLAQARIIVGNQLSLKIKNKFIVDFFLLNLYKDSNGRIQWRFNIDALKILIEKRIINKLVVTQPFSGPSLIIYGEKSDYVRPQDAQQVQSLLPNVQFIGIPDTGHYLHIEKSNQFIDYVVKFLNDAQ